VAAGLVGLLVALRAGGPRSDRRRQLAEALTRDREAPAERDAGAQSEGTPDWPVAEPDGGWPLEPRSRESMDEVPEGVLLRGATADEGDDDETPPGQVELGGFFIDRYEVTNEEYSQCIEAGVCRPPMELDEDRFGSARQPVVGVSWFDAANFCRWAGKRLPTEAEWERAARGDDRRTYPWGDEPPSCERAAYTECDRYGPAEVGGRSAGAGPFGTQDLAGNVWEWVQDWYAPRYYPPGPEGTHQGPPAGRQRVLRGGSWHYGRAFIRAGNRHRDEPAHRTPTYGIRCAYSPPPPTPPPGAAASGGDAGGINRDSGSYRGRGDASPAGRDGSVDGSPRAVRNLF